MSNFPQGKMIDPKKPITAQVDPPATGAAMVKAPVDKPLALSADFGTVYVRVKGNDIMRPIKADMALYEKLGHFYGIYDAKGSKEAEEDAGEKSAKFKYAITSAGYVHLNKVAGISILTPQYVIVDGIQQQNPYIERDRRTKAITSVSIRKIGIGYAPSGSVVVVDKTLFYNTYTYFIQSIQAKMKKKNWKTKLPAHPDAAKIGTETESPGDRWAFFPLESPLGIWINYDDPAIIDCLDEHTQRQRFGDRIAQKIVERNILKDHPAIGVSQVFAKETAAQGKVATVTVYGYRHDLNPTDIAGIMRTVEKGVDSAPFEVKAAVIEPSDIDEERAAIQEEAAGDPGESQGINVDSDDEGRPLFGKMK